MSDINNFRILYFIRNGNEYREIKAYESEGNDYFRINNGKRHADLETYLKTITLKGWKETDLQGYLKAKYKGGQGK